MPETPDADATGGGPATALAEPPKPPSTPPGAVSGATPPPRRKRTGVIVAVVAAVIALAFVAVVVYLVTNSGSNTGSADSTRASFDSAMQKAGVTAAYPGTPVAVTDVTSTGSHPFTATFTPAEVAALLNTFSYESDIAGIRIALRNVSIGVPEPGTVEINASVTANGSTYSGSVTAPLTFSDGRVETTGVTALSAEGIPANDAQKSQVGGALIDYFNAFLAAAPGLSIESASIGPDGVTVTGSAPDSLTYP